MAAAALFAVSCVTDATEDLDVNLGEKSTLTLSLEKTKTHLGDKSGEQYPLYWSAGDRIAVNGVVSEPLAESAHGQVSATFTLAGELTYPCNVVYPAPAEGVVAADGKQVVTFLAEQNYVAGTFAVGAAPLYAQVASVDDAIELQHLSSVLCLAPTGEATLTSATITASMGKLSGNFDLNCADGTLAPQSDASNIVTVNFGEGLALGSEATPIYVALPAGEFGMVEVKFHTATDAMVVKFDTSSAKALKAGVVREFGPFAYVANTSTEATVYDISDVATLKAFASAASTFTTDVLARVTAPIDMSGEEWTPIEGYAYVFDGGNNPITGLTAPLFGVSSGIIRNVVLTDVDITTNDRLVAGGVVCTLINTGLTTPVLENCKVSGKIVVNNQTSKNISDSVDFDTYCYGGVAGVVRGGIVTGCVNETNISVLQVAALDNTLAINPAVGGVVARTTDVTINDTSIFASVYNCVNGSATNSEVGRINYYDNCQSKLYVPHVGGVMGICSQNNLGELKDCVNYGAINFNANAAGTGNHDYRSTTVAGVAGVVNQTIENLYNYGPVTIASGNVGGLHTAGIVGVCKSAIFKNCHNMSSGAITVEEPVRFFSLNVAGVSAGTTYRVKSASEYIDGCTNDAPIVSKASTDTNVTLNGNYIYRVAGISTYNNKSVANCENKAGGDITLSGDIILARNDAQSGFNIGGVYCYSSTVGAHTNNINRGDINVYTNVSKHASATEDQTTFYRVDIGGVASHVQLAPVGDEINYGNITIGRESGEAMSITSNGIFIGGVTGNRHTRAVGANHRAINHGNITVNSGVTLDAGSVDCGICIAGCSAFNVKETTFYNFSNNGNVIVKGTMKDVAYIGGVAAKTPVSLSGVTNTGKVEFAGSASKNIYLGGLLGYNKASTINITNCTNSGDVSLTKYTGKDVYAYIGGLIGRNEGDTVVTNCVNEGAVSTGKDITSTYEQYVGGMVGYNAGAITLDNCTNRTKAGVEWGIVVSNCQAKGGSNTNAMRVGGMVARATGQFVTQNDVTNSAGIYFDGVHIDTGGVSIGGIIGVMASSNMGGNVTNTGNIYYAGRCPSANMGVAGFSATSAGEITKANIVCACDITIASEASDGGLPTSTNKRCKLGGVVAFACTKLENAKFYGDIYLLNWNPTGGPTSDGNTCGMIQGSATADRVANCHCGGNVYNIYDIEDEEYKGEKLSVSNYFNYILGVPLTAADAVAMGCGYLSKLDATPTYPTVE